MTTYHRLLAIWQFCWRQNLTVSSWVGVLFIRLHWWIVDSNSISMTLPYGEQQSHVTLVCCAKLLSSERVPGGQLLLLLLLLKSVKAYKIQCLVATEMGHAQPPISTPCANKPVRGQWQHNPPHVGTRIWCPRVVVKSDPTAINIQVQHSSTAPVWGCS